MINEMAVVDPSVKIAEGVKIGPFAIIGPHVEIGPNTEIMSHAVIKGPTKIGANNKIYQFASLGEECQDKKYHGEDTILEIGDNNVFRENCTVHRGTVQGGGKTVIGDNNLFMVATHVAHDCILGNNIIMSNNASIAGHVEVADYACLGGFSGVHQFCKIGSHCFVAAGSIVLKDVAPYVMVSGHPAAAYGLNTVGLRRQKFSKESLTALSRAYKEVFRNANTVKEAIESLSELRSKFSEVAIFVDFLKNSSRGVVR